MAAKSVFLKATLSSFVRYLYYSIRTLYIYLNAKVLQPFYIRVFFSMVHVRILSAQ